MCEPTTLLAVASTAAGIYGQNQQAGHQNRLAIQSNENANATYIEDTKRQGLIDIQNDEAHSQEAQKLQREGAQARGTAVVAAGEAGVSGLSVESLLGDYYRQEARNLEASRTNNNMGREQRDAERIGLRNRTNSRINNSRRNVRGGTPLWSSALQIGTAGYTTYQRHKRKQLRNNND